MTIENCLVQNKKNKKILNTFAALLFVKEFSVRQNYLLIKTD